MKPPRLAQGAKMTQLPLALCLCLLVASATTTGAQFDEESQIQTSALHSMKEVQELGSNSLAGVLLKLVKQQEEGRDLLKRLKDSSGVGKVADTDIAEVAEITHKMSPLADLLQQGVRDDLQHALIDVVNMSRTKSITEALQTVGAKFSRDAMGLFGENSKSALDLLKRSNVTKGSVVDGFFLSTGINFNSWNGLAWLFDWITPKGFIARLTGSVNMKLTYMHNVDEEKNAFCIGLRLDQTSYGVSRVFKDWSFGAGPVKFGYRPAYALGFRFNTNSNLMPKAVRNFQHFFEAEFTVSTPSHFVAAAVDICMPGVAGCDPRPVEDDVPWYQFIQDLHPFFSDHICVKL